MEPSPSNDKLCYSCFVTKFVNSGDAIAWMSGPEGQDMKPHGGGNHQDNLSGNAKLMVWTLLGSVVPFTPAQPVNVQFCFMLASSKQQVVGVVSLVPLRLGHFGASFLALSRLAGTSFDFHYIFAAKICLAAFVAIFTCCASSSSSHG